MSTQLQLRGGTTAETLLFTGAQREVTVDTDKNTLVVHNGVTPGGFALATEDQVADGTFYYNDDVPGGSAANAYILVPKANTNTPNSYKDGIQLGFVTGNSNTGPSTANFQNLGVKSIKYAGGADPAPGDISGRVNLIYDAGNDWLELQRKAAGAPPQLRTVNGSVSGNALTLTLSPCTIDFRSPTLANGNVLTGVVTSTLSLVIPAGATLGTTNGVQSKIVIVAIYNAGSVELAAINFASGNALDETALINTTAISAAASSATTFYSNTARSGVPYRVMGFVQSTQAAAGTWATTPSQVQGQGGQARIAPVTVTKKYESPEQTITSGGVVTLAHGLGAKPDMVRAFLVCKTAELGWSVGDEVSVDVLVAGGSTYNYSVGFNATNIRAVCGSSGCAINNGTGVTSTITNANWRLVLRAQIWSIN